MVGAWVATKITIADELCWTTADNIVPLLIIQIPIMVSVVVRKRNSKRIVFVIIEMCFRLI